MFIPAEIQSLLQAEDAFDAMMSLKGEAFRDVKGRKTMRLVLNNQSYFIKQHFGVGWGEILKNLVSLKKPIVSAKTEWQAIQKLNAIGIPTTPLVAYGERGCNPATRQSFVMTRDLGDITSLEDFCANWPQHPPKTNFKRQLILAVALLAKTLHSNGMNHRDFYICHLCLDKQKLSHGELYLYLIDLHRVGIHHQISVNDRMKDLAGLYFSSMHIGLTKRDFYRFLISYTGQSLSALNQQQWAFWQKVHTRALLLDAKFKAKVAAGVKL